MTRVRILNSLTTFNHARLINLYYRQALGVLHTRPRATATITPTRVVLCVLISVTKSSDARAIIAQSFAYLSSRVPQWLLEPLHPAQSPHCGDCAGHLFASQLQRTAEKRYAKVYARAGLERHPPAHKMGDLSRLAHTPARLRIRSAYTTEVFWQPRSAHVARTVSSTVTVGDDVIADGVSLLNVGSGMVRT